MAHYIQQRQIKGSPTFQSSELGKVAAEEIRRIEIELKLIIACDDDAEVVECTRRSNDREGARILALVLLLTVS